MSTLNQASNAGSGGATEVTQLQVLTKVTSIDNKTPALGQAASAASSPVVLSTEQEGLIGSKTETAPASDTASSGLNGRLQRVAQRITSMIALLPAALGSTAAASSFAVTASTEDVARQGIITETAPATDTASSGQNGRLQRIAQRLTSLIALFPTALGSAAAASSFAVTASTEDVARQGIITETAPASDTASSGQNGRLQRIAQRLTSLIALFPTALGQGTMATSFKVVLPSDQSAIATKDPVNAAGSIVNTPLSATTASSAVAPANAVGFLFEAPSTNTDSIRWCVGSTASTTVGMLAEPGRDSGYIPIGFGATVSVCATVSGTNAFSIQWVLSA